MEFYIYVKIFHFWAFISWMAMLFYLPRLFVYHVENIQNSGFVEVVKIQEEKLYKFIGYPALISVLISGVLMIILNPSLLSFGWFHAKLTCALLLVIYHFSLGYYLRLLKEDKCKKSGRFFRAYNEVPTILMTLIIIFALLK